MDQIRSSNDRCCQFGQGLRQGVHGIRQLLDLRLTELVVGLGAITFPLRVEQCLHGRELSAIWLSRAGSLSRSRGRSPLKATSAPSILAWKSHRSVPDQYSSSPVTLPVATSSSRPRDPSAISSARKSRLGTLLCRIAVF